MHYVVTAGAIKQGAANTNPNSTYYDEDSKLVAKALKILGRKAGIYGMIGGQTVDIEAEAGNQTMDEETFIKETKA